MNRFFKLLIIIAVAVGIGVVVGKLNEQKQVFLSLSEEEQRAYLAAKIGSKVPEEKLAEIQDAVIAAVNGRG